MKQSQLHVWSCRRTTDFGLQIKIQREYPQRKRDNTESKNK